MREIGYYWVNRGNEWQICHWDGELFYETGSDIGNIDIDFEQIDETRIIRK